MHILYEENNKTNRRHKRKLGCMEKGIIFLERRNQYCQQFNSSQVNVHIQCNFNQNHIAAIVFWKLGQVF